MASENAGDNLWLAEQWLQHRERMIHLLAARMPAVLRRRLSPEDVAQETYLACGKRLDFLLAQPEVPIFVKFRRIALQTLTDLERHHLMAGKRDAMRESELPERDDDDAMDAWAGFADSISSPRSHLVKLERQAAIRRILTELPAQDREILELRHFEELSNNECAAVLELTQKTASIRYVRALKRFRDLITAADL